MGLPKPTRKPEYGSRLLPQVLDELAAYDSERIYAAFPKTADLKDGFRTVTMAQMARAVNHIAWWLKDNIGTSSSFETISYLGVPDIRYAIVFLAAVKCGYKVLFPSPRNTIQINNSLLDQTDCTKFFASPEVLPIAESLAKERKGLVVLTVEALDDMLVDASDHYPYDVVLGPSNKPSTGQTAAEVMRQMKLKALFCPPNIYEQLLQEPDGLELTKNLDFVMYAGGPLTTTTGTTLSKVTDVCGFYGSTETGPAQTLVPARVDWDTLEFHPMYGADMQPSVDEAFELVLHIDTKLQGIRGLDNNCPNIDIWRTKDLFRPHASKPNLWRFHGRTDDIIVLSNGEKFNPVPSEAIINSHQSVSAALIIGQGRFLPALLIEPADTSPTLLIEELWPTIEKANAQAQGHGRIIRTMIAVADPSKPFERAGKGTVIRKLTTAKYATEIKALYSGSHLGNLQGAPALNHADNVNAIRGFVRQVIDMSFPVKGIKGADDLYVLGLDSLKTIEITSMLRAGLRDHNVSGLSGQTLYTHPSMDELAEWIHKSLNTSTNGILDPKIYCLDRTPDARSKHTELLQQSLTTPVNFLQVNFSRSASAKYTELSTSTTTIIHSAWNVDFNRSLSSFVPIHIQGVRNIIHFSLHSPLRPHIIFISSASSVSNGEQQPIPESFIPNHSAAQRMGYAESKNVAEHILHHASHHTGITSTILRIGQIAGPLSCHGCVWNEDEWVPTLIKTSKSLGCLPRGIPHVDWIPVDSLSRIIAELATSTARKPKGQSSVYNIVNPHPVPWSTLLPTLQSHLNSRTRSTAIVDLEEWMGRLDALDASDANILKAHPAIKILPFFRDLNSRDRGIEGRYITERGVRDSATMAGLRGIDGRAMEGWLQQWGY
ncbi:MAG: hypothetical protein Q9209_001067 [Squamulea sp. 1 TL-2023]